MTWRAAAMVTVAGLAWSLAAPTPARPTAAAPTACCGCTARGGEEPSEEAPGPEGPGRGPCEEGCPRICCTGNASVLLSTPGVAPDVLAGMTEPSLIPPDAALARGYLSRIFRPPRP